MSSLTRRIQKKGSRIGAPSRQDAPDKLARKERERRNATRKVRELQDMYAV